MGSLLGIVPWQRWTICLSVLLGLLGLGVAASHGQFDATTRSPYDVQMAFAIPGRVKAVHVQPGGNVQAGDLLAELDDSIHQAQLELHRITAENDAEVRVAQQRLTVAKLDEQRVADSHPIAAAQLQRAAARRRLAELELELAESRLARHRQQFKLAEAQHDQYRLYAQGSGTVEQIMVSRGQMIEPGTSVLRLLRSDVLWIDVPVPTQRTYDLKLGIDAWARHGEGQGQGPIRGRIVHLARAIRRESDTRLVRVQIPNDRGLLVGAHVSVTFQRAHIDPAQPRGPSTATGKVRTDK